MNRYILNDIAINARQQKQQLDNEDKFFNVVNISVEHDEQFLSNSTQWENFDKTSTWTTSAKSKEVHFDFEPCLNVSFHSSLIQGPSDSSLEYFDCYGDGKNAVAAGSPIYSPAGFARTREDEKSALHRKCPNKEVDYESDPTNVPKSRTTASSIMHNKVPRTTRPIFGSIENEHSSLRRRSRPVGPVLSKSIIPSTALDVDPYTDRNYC
jgi:hypothetical protein